MPTSQSPSSRLSVIACRLAAVAVVASASALGAQAQQAAQPVAPSADASAPQLLSAINYRPMDFLALAGVKDDGVSSSSSSSSAADVPADPSATLVDSPDAMQPPPRRRYGSPRYNDNQHNSDGSNKYTFVAGVGLTLPTGDTYHYFNTSYGFQVGGGRNFNKHFGVLLQFDYDHFGINGATLSNQLNLYNEGCSASTGCLGSLDGSNHVWSFTLNPTYTFYQGDKFGGYVVGGVGFYHKVTNFTTPETGYVDYFGYLIQEEQNAVIDHYSSNAPGFNGGFGMTYKFSRFAGERFFVEARYVFVDNSQRYGYVYANNANGYTATGPNADQNNEFPANSNRTTYIPIKVGIRF
jgi:hypothetical protein